MSANKIIVAGWCTVDPRKRDDVVGSFEVMVLRARTAPGCLDFAITADPVDPGRINTFEFWQTETELHSWRADSHPPRKFAAMLRMEVQQHVIERSGSPFGRHRKKP